MKKLYLVIALLVAIPISLISKVDIGFQPQAHTQNSGAVKMDRNLNISEYSKDKNSFPSSLSSFNKLDSTIDLYWNAYFNDVTPISYEPISGVLFMVQSNRYNRISGSDTLFHGDIYLYYSTDKGKSWSKETIFSKDGDIAVMPSVTVSNPTKSKNPNDLFVVVFTRLFRQDPLSPDNYPLFGGLYIISDGVGLTDNNFFEYEEPGPAQNNPGYYWGLSKGVSYSGNGNSFSYFYGTLYDRNIYQYGLYGISNMAFKSGDGLISNNSFMPAPWGLTTWRASDAIGSSYNAPMLVDVDEEGTLYAVFNNIFADNTERRAVAVAKSTDNGETWSEFDRFPQSVWDAYNTKYNLQSSFCPSLLPYGSNAFVVTGVNEFSFIMPFYKAPLDTNIQDPEGVFVEVYKVKGEWKMRDVAPSTIGIWRAPYLITDTSEAATVDDNFSDNPRDYEVQLAKTADGQSILFKYIDNRDSLVELKKALKLVNGPTVEATLTTDIFVTYRDAADKNGWSKPTTITNDIWMNRSTWIPSIIPSLKEVPILEFINIPFTNPQNVRVMAEYPKFIQNFVIGSGIRNWILNSTFDATAGENIKNSTLQNPEGAVVSVDDLINVDINSFNIYPNPVTSTATISYEIANNAYVKIEIFNNMGELVKTVRDYSLATVGVTGFEFDASDLASGSYYISMTANGRKVTKLMNVVR